MHTSNMMCYYYIIITYYNIIL